MSPELVSIVVVAYNNWPDLELAIQSALCQSYQPVEVIVVDNSSTDTTHAEVNRIFRDRIHYIQQPNRGDSGAYNTGLRAAQGSFIQFLDGDDVLAPNKIEKQMQIFAAHLDTDVVYGEVRCFKTLLGAAILDDTGVFVDRGDLLKAFLTDNQSTVHSVGTLSRREALSRVGFFDESLYNADVEYLVRLLWAGCRFRYCPGIPMAFYRCHPRQMSANALEMSRGCEALWAKVLHYVDREPYRGFVVERLAWARLHRATRRYGMNVRDAIAKLAEARATHHRVVSLGVYIAGLALVIAPGGRRFMRSDLFRSLRHAFGKLVGNKDP
jgi:glycosyltransferase involved in cell wall biosynthesis